jgi:hypothetical protein
VALTVEEANAVNTVLEFFLLPDLEKRPPLPMTTDAQARQAAVLLAEHANKKLMAGLRPEQVTARWPGVPF